MYSLRKTAFILFGLGLVGATFLSGGVRLNSFNIQIEGRDFVVTWKVDVEEDVREYELLRKTAMSNDQFVKVFAARPHGTGKDYIYRDTQVYKSGSEQLDYRLDAVYSSGLREILTMKSINYTSTAVRRTWGSLKALFQ
ncbi:MAG: hypothetical protein BMS9Abin05_1120 [Rhodothermia bacterium]|nr:MAG: hypothetical protein BMS9Abin05_1120 [Rhodothermia bacterium]